MDGRTGEGPRFHTYLRPTLVCTAFVHAILVFTRGFASAPLPKLRGVQITAGSHLLGAIREARGEGIPVDAIAAALASPAPHPPSR